MIERSTFGFIGTDVKVITRSKQTECDIEPFFENLVVDAGKLDKAFSVALLDGERLLAALQFGDGDRFSEVRVDQLLSLAIDALQTSALRCNQLLILLALRRQLVRNRSPHRRNKL